MSKKRKLKKKVSIIVGLIVFFTIYFLAFKMTSNQDNKLDEKNNLELENAQEDNPEYSSLLEKLKESKKIFISDKKVSDVKIEDDTWQDVLYSFSQLKKVRNSEQQYKPTYVGYTDNGVKYSTDFNFFRVYTVRKEEYYKIPVEYKKDFKVLMDRSLYSSFDLLSKYKSWNSVEITYNNKSKDVSKWKFSDFASKMMSKRVVGKIQPEINAESSKYNFVINIDYGNYKIKVYTMGSDYVKVTANNVDTYYEVYNNMYDYIKNNIFGIRKK